MVKLYRDVIIVTSLVWWMNGYAADFFANARAERYITPPIISHFNVNFQQQNFADYRVVNRGVYYPNPTYVSYNRGLRNGREWRYYRSYGGNSQQSIIYDPFIAAYYSGYYYPFVAGATDNRVYQFGHYYPGNHYPGQWIPVNYGHYPARAMVVGYGQYGQPMYRCRVWYRQAYHYGNAIGQYCYVRYAARSIEAIKFQVLVAVE